MTDQTTNKTTLKDLETECSTLDRVSHRLAMTDAGPPFEKVLSLLLPRLLSRIGKNDDAKRENRRGVNKRKIADKGNVDADGSQLDEMYETIHKKLIEMLMHVMKRVRDDQECKLPCGLILDLLQPDTNAFTVNLSLAFLTLGVNRHTPVECAGLLPGLLEFMELLLLGDSGRSVVDDSNCSVVGVGHWMDPSRKMRYNQTWHLILRCLEKVSYNPLENAAARRVTKSGSTVLSQSANDTAGIISASSLTKTKELLLSRPIIAAAMFDLFLDVFLYAPVPVTSTLIPNGMSTFGYYCLVGGAASEKSSCKSWKEEYASRTKLKELKIKLLDLIAPCKRVAIFLSDENASKEASDADVVPKSYLEGLGISRTVALLVLLSGDVDLDVKNKAESYLKAHMDTFRGKEDKRSNSTYNTDNFAVISDPLLGNQVALAISLLSYALGGLASKSVIQKMLEHYQLQIALSVAEIQLGLIYRTSGSDDEEQKVLLSCCRMKLQDSTITPALKFVSKMLNHYPKLFYVMDMAHDEADIAAACISTLIVSIFGDLWKPGSSGSFAVDAAASLLNASCLRLSLFYEYRQPESSNRLQLLLAKSMSLACAVLAPISSGSSSSLSSTGTRVATTQVEIRDKIYGIVCTLARSNRFSLHERYSLFDCGNSEGAMGTFTSTSTAKLLFGCATNELEALKPRATSTLDALLAAYVRVVKNQTNKVTNIASKTAPPTSNNPWAPTNTQTNFISDQKSIKAPSLDSLSHSLLPLLWSAARRSQTQSSRLCAARWSHELLLAIDSKNAYHLLCFLSGDDDSSVSMVCNRALGIEGIIGQDISMSPVHPASSEQESMAKFSELVTVVLNKEMITGRPTYNGFHVRARASTLRFLLQLLLDENSIYEEDQLNMYVITILKTLRLFQHDTLTRDKVDLLDECAICLAGCTSSSREARLIVKSDGFNGIVDHVFMSNSSKARRHLAEVIRHLYEDESLWNDKQDFSRNNLAISAWISSSNLLENAKLCREKLITMSEASYALGEVHGAAFLGSSCVRAFRLAMSKSANAINENNVLQCWEACGDIVSLLGKGLSHRELVVGNACSSGLVTAFDYEGQEAPMLDFHLYESVAIALNELNLSIKHFSSIDHAEPTRVSSLVKASGVILAASTSGAGCKNIGPSRIQCTESLFGILGSTVHRKDEELSLHVGEALVKYADAIGSGEWSSTSESFYGDGLYDEALAYSLPPHNHVLYTILKREIIATNPIKKTACAGLLLAIVGHASRLVLLNSAFASRTMVKELFGQLKYIQHSFIQLLRNPKSKQLARECCCRGLAACRGLSMTYDGSESHRAVSDTLNDHLLQAFGATSNYGRSAMIENEEQARDRRNETENDVDERQQTEVGGAAGMGEAALGAYREMANAAMAIERPDLLYTLMILSTNHPIWIDVELRDRYDAKSLLGNTTGLNDAEIRVALKPHLGKLIPSLIRACHEPNKQTREQMNALWVSLTGGGSAARDMISQNLIRTLDTLIKDASSKLWRTRAGACGALADIIVGRSWDDLGGGDVEDDEEEYVCGGTAIRLLRLWKSSVRALDDVRTPVRERGDILARAVRALTIRLCDPLAKNITADEEIFMSDYQKEEDQRQRDKNAEKAAEVSLRWLVHHGLNQPCAEATGICVSCILGIVHVAKPSTLQPVLDSLIGALLMAMSGLEPAALNYLQVRAAGNGESNSNENYDRLESARVRLAMSGPIHSALQKCLDMIKHIDHDAQKKVVLELDSALRRGSGFATRAAVADAVTTLCNICPNAFNCPGLSTTNPSVRLFRALYFASERERGSASKDKMTHALGSLAELVPGKAVRTLVAKACERYSESSGSNNDPSIRKAASATVRAVVVRAPSQLSDGGANDVWAKIVLPTAYLGKHDQDAKVGFLWSEVWEEGSSAVGSGDNSFGVMLQEKILPSLTSSIIDNLQSTSWSNRVNACAVITELVEANILAPPPSPINNAHCQKDERFRVRAQSSSFILFECIKIITRSRIWLGKGNVLKAAALIAGKWAAVISPNKSTQDEPMTFSSCQDDLFKGDSWFKSSSDNKADQTDEEDVNCNEVTLEEVDDEHIVCEDEVTLDLSDEASFDYDDEEQDARNHSDVKVTQDTKLTFLGFCRLLCDQGLQIKRNEFTEGVLPYMSSALSNLSILLRAMATNECDLNCTEVRGQQRLAYNLLAPRLYEFVVGSQAENSVPPLLVANALECLASVFHDGAIDDSGAEFIDSLGLLKFFMECSGVKQPAWSVRLNGVLAASNLVSKMASTTLRKNETIVCILDCSSHALKDRKFWKVRQAGLELVLSLINRVGKQRVSDQLLLEAVLPYKENIVTMAHKSLADNESEVTATASRISLAMSWWP